MPMNFSIGMHELQRRKPIMTMPLGVACDHAGLGLKRALLSARMSRQHNDANVLCLGARVVGTGTAIDIVEAFLGAGFEGGRHAARVAKIDLA
jgi:hypothetical protein